jgi:hypothetical protein
VFEPVVLALRVVKSAAATEASATEIVNTPAVAVRPPRVVISVSVIVAVTAPIPS